MILGLGLGDLLSLATVVLGLIGGVLNIHAEETIRHYSFIIWTIANLTGVILNYLAYMGLVVLTLGFLLFAVLNGIYAVIDVVGVYNTRRCQKCV